MTVTPLSPADVPAATRMLAAAFADYPLFRAIAPNNPQAVEAFCGMLVRYTARLGTAYATADGAAVACWFPPGHPTPTAVGMVRAGVVGLVRELGMRGGVLMWRLERQFDRARTAHVPGPHWYLPFLGVDPAARRRGLARAVLQPVIACAARDGLPCYLETQDETVVPAYARLGFPVVGSRRVAGGLRNWELCREPGGAARSSAGEGGNG
jgi:GNAT superfamily N-acetyltransferase